MDDNDLGRRLRRLAEEASPRPGSAEDVLRRGRVRRRVAAVGAGLMAIVLIGGVAGAVTLFGDRDGIDPAPGPEETSPCVSVGYDLAVFVPAGATDAEIEELEQRLHSDGRIMRGQFVSAEEAEREFRDKEPQHEGPLSTTDSTDQFRLRLGPGLDPDAVADELAEVGAGAYVPARDCPPENPERTFARYFFEVDEGNTSASGVLEVDSARRTICLSPTLSSNIKAVHLIDQEPEVPGATGSNVPERAFVLSFIDPQDPPEDAYEPSGGGAVCLRDQDRALLQQIIEEPVRFALDFHRGPNDDPGLVARLKERPPATGERCGFPTVRPTYLPWLGEGEQPGSPTRSFDEEIDRAQLSWRHSSGDVGVTVYPEDLAPSGEPIGVKIDGINGYLHRGEGGTVSVSWDLDARCNLLELSISLSDATQQELERELVKVARSLTTPREASDAKVQPVEDAVAWLSDRVEVPVALPTNLPAGIRVDKGRSVTVDRGGNVVAGRLKLRFGEKGILIFDFGSAGFDGCGGDGAEEVDINGAPGLMLAKDRYPWTQIIWPARPGDTDATYGIYGSLRGAELLELARSMKLALEAEGTLSGC